MSPSGETTIKDHFKTWESISCTVLGIYSFTETSSSRIKYFSPEEETLFSKTVLKISNKVQLARFNILETYIKSVFNTKI